MRLFIFVILLKLLSAPAFSASVTVNLQGTVIASTGLGFSVGDAFGLAITYDSTPDFVNPSGTPAFSFNSITQISLDTGTSILDYLPGVSAISQIIMETAGPGSLFDRWLAGADGFSGTSSGSLNLSNLILAFPSGTFVVPIGSLALPFLGDLDLGSTVASGTLNGVDWNLTGEFGVVPEPATLTLLGAGLIAGASWS